MYSKVYNVSVFIDVHSVNCPGVWLCPKGKVVLQLHLFGVSDFTRALEPAFPLEFNERFTFHKIFRNQKTLNELHSELDTIKFDMQLLQFPESQNDSVLLAVFYSKLVDVLYIPKKDNGNPGLELLFRPCDVFPGIISPKADVSTRIKIIESFEDSKSSSSLNASKFKKLGSKSPEKPAKIRQNPVCHTKNYSFCRCFDDKQSLQKPFVVPAKSNKKCSNESLKELPKSECAKPVVKKKKVLRSSTEPQATPTKNVNPVLQKRPDLQQIYPKSIPSSTTEPQASPIKKVNPLLQKRPDLKQNYSKIPVVKSSELVDCGCQLCKKYELYFREKTDRNLKDSSSESNDTDYETEVNKSCRCCCRKLLDQQRFYCRCKKSIENAANHLLTNESPDEINPRQTFKQSLYQHKKMVDKETNSKQQVINKPKRKVVQMEKTINGNKWGVKAY